MRLSIIMPVYNAGAFLPEAVESLLAQTFVDFELLIVDDHSSDNSWEYLLTLEDPRVHIWRQQVRTGQGAARNRAMHHATGEFIAFADADDISLPERFELQIRYMNHHPEVGLLGTRVVYLAASGRTGFGPPLAEHHDDIRHDLLRGRHAIANATLLMRRVALVKAELFRIDGAGEDWDFFLRMSETTRVANLPDVLVQYRLHGGSTNALQANELRLRYDHACESARRRAAGLPELAFSTFVSHSSKVSSLHKIRRSADLHAGQYYRAAIVNLLNRHYARGYTSLMVASLLSPERVLQRLGRSLRKFASLTKPEPPDRTKLPKTETIIVFQIGSLGDTVIALPCYREIARRHPDAKILILTNLPASRKMVQADAIVSATGLVDGAIDYPMPLRGVANIRSLYRRMRDVQATRLYYLTPEKHLLNLLRHCAFFKLCGIHSLHAVPWTQDMRYPRHLEGSDLWESEASRLLRTLEPSRFAGPPTSDDRDLCLSVQERSAAATWLQQNLPNRSFCAVSVGGKVPINNWGDANWASALSRLSEANPELGLVLVGSADERPRNEGLLQAWRGACANACGVFSPRQTAALIEQASAFFGHDTGTLHLAAAVQTPIVGVYSSRNVAGKWYSDRIGDEFLYTPCACAGCELEKIADCPYDRLCMTAHDVDDFLVAAQRQLYKSLPDTAEQLVTLSTTFMQSQ